MPPAFTCMGMRTLANQGLKWLEQAISSVAVQLLLNRLELEPKWLRTSVLALLLKLLLCCVVLGGVIVCCAIKSLANPRGLIRTCILCQPPTCT